MKKNQKKFLCVGILVVMVSIVIILIEFFDDLMTSYEHALKSDVYKNTSEFWFWCVLELILTKVPLILSEISLIRNGYLLMVKGQLKSNKIFCFISLMLAVTVLVFLYISVNSNYMYHMRQNYIMASWLLLLISFVLECVRYKEK